MMAKVLMSLVALFLFVRGHANQLAPIQQEIDTILIQFQADTDSVGFQEQQAVRQVKFKRGKAILFTIFTGLLGGHRIYLGTHHRTPIIYSVTLGGLGILPLVDLINLIFTKDINKFDNKTQIIMWAD
ncbi:MAG: TM2 domain-containing protein [Flavobacteriales bacterium]|nr:TM2 domain-containing protein [Flavobacteriales bacterium]